MQVTINSRNLNPSQQLKDKIEGKLSKLDKYFSRDAEATVMLSEVKTGLAKLEATINAGGMTFRAEESNADLLYCLDQVIDKLSKQMSRFKSRLVKKHKDQGFVNVEEIPDIEEAESRGIVRTKRFTLSPMSADEAILQMEMLEHSFFIFLNSSIFVPSFLIHPAKHLLFFHIEQFFPVQQQHHLAIWQLADTPDVAIAG